MKEITFLTLSLPISHSKTSKGETFRWVMTAFEIAVEPLSMGVVEVSEGPLMLRDTI
jgi:hypothetical protein